MDSDKFATSAGTDLCMMPLAVAQTWYQSRELDDGVVLIWEPHVHPFARCNIWYVKGEERDLLIDSGTGLRPLMPVLPRSPGRPLVAVATHAHFDHIGALHHGGHGPSFYAARKRVLVRDYLAGKRQQGCPHRPT